MKTPLVYVIVLNWNGKELTRQCLKSLQKVSYKNVRILVVDNGSTDGSVAAVQAQFPAVEVLALPSNRGFAAGNNAGFARVKRHQPQYVIFLNNDTTTDPDFIQPLVQPLADGADLGQTVPKIFYHQDPRRIWYAGGTVNLWTGLIHHRGIRRLDGVNFERREETGYATGCCFCMRTADFDRMGGFDESYRMYAEDVDLSLRVREEGQGVLFVPQSKVWHQVSASLGGALKAGKLRRRLRGMLRLYGKHASWIQKVSITLYWIFLMTPYFGFKGLYLKLRG